MCFRSPPPRCGWPASSHTIWPAVSSREPSASVSVEAAFEALNCDLAPRLVPGNFLTGWQYEANHLDLIGFHRAVVVAPANFLPSTRSTTSPGRA